MYESRHHPPLPWAKFCTRLLWHVAGALLLILLSLFLGAAGHVYFELHSWHDGFLNGAMMLGGMGPLTPPVSNAGKLFVGLYALYAGLVFVAAIGMMLAPVAHRVLHLFHREGHKT
ncbi:hypothetical protein WAE56_20935 [Iodobacter sp. LRB]|uniref:hypothetical protein n=1 Tax=unclassified Iodobacter TaxID=235634 RepID=UPI000C10E56A|nr:hypothetical protein [Iodobacter sp. BJB302]PHV03010.1 hypothetical protein CSQ88_03535 [Iodobacter sp. BJB302]